MMCKAFLEFTDLVKQSHVISIASLLKCVSLHFLLYVETILYPLNSVSKPMSLYSGNNGRENL